MHSILKVKLGIAVFLHLLGEPLQNHSPPSFRIILEQSDTPPKISLLCVISDCGMWRKHNINISENTNTWFYGQTIWISLFIYTVIGQKGQFNLQRSSMFRVYMSMSRVVCSYKWSGTGYQVLKQKGNSCFPLDDRLLQSRALKLQKKRIAFWSCTNTNGKPLQDYNSCKCIPYWN